MRRMWPSLIIRYDPNDACEAAIKEWIPLAEPHTWPHILTFDSIAQLLETTRALLGDAPRRQQISARMKRFFSGESERAEGHARVSLLRALRATNWTARDWTDTLHGQSERRDERRGSRGGVVASATRKGATRHASGAGKRRRAGRAAGAVAADRR